MREREREIEREFSIFAKRNVCFYFMCRKEKKNLLHPPSFDISTRHNILNISYHYTTTECKPQNPMIQIHLFQIYKREQTSQRITYAR